MKTLQVHFSITSFSTEPTASPNLLLEDCELSFAVFMSWENCMIRIIQILQNIAHTNKNTRSKWCSPTGIDFDIVRNVFPLDTYIWSSGISYRCATDSRSVQKGRRINSLHDGIASKLVKVTLIYPIKLLCQNLQ